MKLIGLLLIAGALILGAGAPSAWGTLVQFDEFGAGFIDGAPLTSGVGVDPLSGVTGLYYTLPIPVVAGDVLLLEPPGRPPGQPPEYSDIIRFEWLAGDTTTVFFFSLAEEGETQGLADITEVSMQQILNGLQTNNISVREEVYSLDSPEGWNGVKYAATDGLPGHRQGQGPDVLYDITSDVPPPVPEPVTMAGLMLGIGGLVTYVRKRRTA
jgi:hypothetical protein